MQDLLQNGVSHFAESHAAELAAHLLDTPHTLLPAEQLRAKYLPIHGKERPAIGHLAGEGAVCFARLVSPSEAAHACPARRSPGRASASADQSSRQADAGEPQPDGNAPAEGHMFSHTGNDAAASSAGSDARPAALPAGQAQLLPNLAHALDNGGPGRACGYVPAFVHVPPPLMPQCRSERAPLTAPVAPALVWDDSAELMPSSVQQCRQLLAEAQTRALSPPQHKDFLLALVRGVLVCVCCF